MKKSPLVIFSIFSILFTWTGCSQKTFITNPVLTENPTPATITATETATLLPTLTSTVTWTPSPTIPPPKVTQLPIYPTSKLTSLPTLSRIDRQAYLAEHLPDNNNCDLPCWLGIQPGSTSWQKAFDFLSNLGLPSSDLSMEDGSIFHMVSFDFENPYAFHEYRILEQHELVRSIYIYTTGGDRAPAEFQKIWKLYSPQKIILSYGSPSRIWLSTDSGDFGDRHPYDLVLAYDQRGFTIHYEGWLKRSGTNFRICPRFEQMMDSLEIYLQSPDDPQPLEGPGNLRNPEFISKWSKPIEEATGLDEKQFSELFTHYEGVNCFNTPVDIWPEFRTLN